MRILIFTIFLGGCAGPHYLGQQYNDWNPPMLQVKFLDAFPSDQRNPVRFYIGEQDKTLQVMGIVNTHWTSIGLPDNMMMYYHRGSAKVQTGESFGKEDFIDALSEIFTHVEDFDNQIQSWASPIREAQKKELF